MAPLKAAIPITNLNFAIVLHFPRQQFDIASIKAIGTIPLLNNNLNLVESS